jgi:uncharacterized protein (TIGR02996 family)
MSDQDAFIRALIANPGDPAVRLVYADWLEERGDRDSSLRAEYLRRECRVDGFPRAPANDEPGRVFCPAFARVIDDGLCWECCMADQGGPTSTAEELRRWVARSGRFASVADFQQVCAGCPHCAWRPAETGQEREIE